MMNRRTLTRYAWLSIATAIVTISLKTTAYLLTGSVGLLSDALESIVNLVAAIMALAMLLVAALPPDENHTYGHSKAEYFSSAVEGLLILVAAVSIVWAAIPRLFAPQPFESIGIGLAISTVGSVINFVVAQVLLRAGRRYDFDHPGSRWSSFNDGRVDFLRRLDWHWAGCAYWMDRA